MYWGYLGWGLGAGGRGEVWESQEQVMSGGAGKKGDVAGQEAGTLFRGSPRKLRYGRDSGPDSSHSEARGSFNVWNTSLGLRYFSAPMGTSLRSKETS